MGNLFSSCMGGGGAAASHGASQSEMMEARASPSPAPPPLPAAAAPPPRTAGQYVTGKLGGAVASGLRSGEYDEAVGNWAGAKARDRETQQRIGASIAANSENEYVRALAGHEGVQTAVGDAFARAAESAEVRHAVANKMAEYAEDPEVQRKVASASWSAAKFGGKVAWGAAKLGGRAAAAGSVAAVNSYRAQAPPGSAPPPEDQPQ